MLVTNIVDVLSKAPYLAIPPDMLSAFIKFEDLPWINGCGAASGITKGIAPTDIDGICILPACLIHDHRYHTGESLQDKYKADIEFLMNINTILINHPSTLTLSIKDRQLRFEQAMILFRFVHEYGIKAFAAGRFVDAEKPKLLDQMILSFRITVQTCLIPIRIFKQAIQTKVSGL